jgi:hypothetical protein
MKLLLLLLSACSWEHGGRHAEDVRLPTEAAKVTPTAMPV